MDWTIGIPLVALLLLACPLMMVGMMAFGWLFMRGRSGGHGGHGMMCMGHGDHSSAGAHDRDRAGVIGELKAERERLDSLITAAENETHPA
ncbi:MAG: hypothetical protein Q7T33_13145 [Dehalococcoidia bacterium]|nr:hypothetical protein [Dehalococcoidia bacterium]